VAGAERSLSCRRLPRKCRCRRQVRGQRSLATQTCCSLTGCGPYLIIYSLTCAGQQLCALRVLCGSRLQGFGSPVSAAGWTPHAAGPAAPAVPIVAFGDRWVKVLTLQLTSQQEAPQVEVSEVAALPLRPSWVLAAALVAIPMALSQPSGYLLALALMDGSVELSRVSRAAAATEGNDEAQLQLAPLLTACCTQPQQLYSAALQPVWSPQHRELRIWVAAGEAVAAGPRTQ
jgi:hypothetical protein